MLVTILRIERTSDAYQMQLRAGGEALLAVPRTLPTPAQIRTGLNVAATFVGAKVGAQSMHGFSNNLEFYLGPQLPGLTGLDLFKLRLLIDLSCFPGAACDPHRGMSWDKPEVDEWVERFRTDADFADSVSLLLGNDDGDDDGVSE